MICYVTIYLSANGNKLEYSIMTSTNSASFGIPFKSTMRISL